MCFQLLNPRELALCAQLRAIARKGCTILPLINAPSKLGNERLETVLAKYRSGPSFSSKEYAEQQGVSKRTAELDLRRLEQLGLATRSGQGKSVRWRVH